MNLTQNTNTYETTGATVTPLIVVSCSPEGVGPQVSRLDPLLVSTSGRFGAGHQRRPDNEKAP